MSNVTVLPKINLPAELVEQFATLNGEDDLNAGVSAGFPVMSIRGAKWRISEGGEEHPIFIPGTEDLAPSIKVVLLRANPAVSKTYYEGAYVEGTDAKPDCYSNDGVKPGADAEHPQAPNCAQCPKNVWGSKISPNGSKIKACSDVRRVAILPLEDMTYSPILLRVPAASLGDLAAYGKALKQRKIPYAAVATKLSFDPDASYPKILFQFERVLTAEEMQVVAERMTDPVVDDVLGLSEPRVRPASATEPADDKFGIPADVQPVEGAAIEAAAEPAGQSDEAPTVATKATRTRKTTPKAAPPQPEADDAGEAQTVPPAAEPGMMDEINAALADLKM